MAEALFSDLNELARFGAERTGGISRTAFSPAFVEAQAWLLQRMADAGLAVRIDAAGNVIGRHGPQGPAVVSASHIDTVPNGGALDGALGVIAGLEAFRRLKARGHAFDRALEIIAFADEEGEYFSLFGSRAMLGLVTPEEITAALGGKGKSLTEALREAGLDPTKVAHARRSKRDFHAYVELHIEQGPVLERLGRFVGIVTNIVGIEVTEFAFTGRPDHSGTTPLDMRQDALRAAVEFCKACYDLARAADPALRLNFGALSITPKALNVVPGRGWWCNRSFAIPIRLSSARSRKRAGAWRRAAPAGLAFRRSGRRCRAMSPLRWIATCRRCSIPAPKAWASRSMIWPRAPAMTRSFSRPPAPPAWCSCKAPAAAATVRKKARRLMPSARRLPC